MFINQMDEKSIINVVNKLKLIGYIWAAIGTVIVVSSNIIVLNEIDIEILFIPINPRNNALVAFLLLVPALILIVSLVLKKKFTATN